MRHDMIPPGDGRTVSATYFVRNFSELKRTAEHAPVYVEAHGKSGWALVSTALLDSMMQGRVDLHQDSAARLDIILDNISTRALLLNESLEIARSNAAARSHLGLPDLAHPISLSAVFQEPVLSGIQDAARRARDSGSSETFEVDSRRYPGCVIKIVAARIPGGVAILFDDVTDAAELRMARADLAALKVAVSRLPGLCIGRINLRGAIDTADDCLSELSGASPDALIGTRIATLFDMASRARVNELVDQVLGGGRPGWTNATLLARGADPVQTSLGIAAIQDRQGVTGASFIMQEKQCVSPPA